MNISTDSKVKDSGRSHDSREREQYQQQMPTHHRPPASSQRGAAKIDTKYTDRHDYKRPNTILDPYVFRQASDTDVNYQIIKKTLNKEIPTPSFNRKNADLNAGLSLSSRINTHAHLSQNTSEMNALRKDKTAPEPRLVYLDSKQPHEIYQEKLAKQNEMNKLQYPSHAPYHSGQPMENHINFEAKATHPTHSTPMANHQYAIPTNHRQNQLPISMPQQPKLLGQGTAAEPNHVPYETSARPKLEARKEKSTPAVQQQQPANLSVNDVSSTKSSSATLFGPTKRESPLDLSVKTVKTKADSTGVYDYSLPSRRPDTIPPSLKVDFAPNFTNSSPDLNLNRANSANYRPPNRTETLPSVPNQMTNMISNHVNHTQISSQLPISQATYSQQMELHQRHQSQFNMNIDPAARYKAPNMDNCVPYPPTKSNSRTTTATAPTSIEQKARKDMQKMPTIFGQKPEELKNFKPDERAYQIDASNKHANEGSSSAAYNKTGGGKINMPPSTKYNPKEKELAYRASQGYSNIQSNIVRHNEYPIANERQSEVIQFVSHPRQQSLNRPSETSTIAATTTTTTTTTTIEHHKQLPYPPYNHFDATQRSQSQTPVYNQSHPNAEYSMPNKVHDERYKMGHPFMERGDAHYASTANLPQKRTSENGLIDQIPMKQPRYDHHDEVKYQQCVNNYPYYPHQDRNMAMYAPQYAPNTKVSEKAISTPVIVQPQHVIANEAKYHYSPYSNMNNESKHGIPMRPNENYEQSGSKVNAPTFRPSQYYPSNHYVPTTSYDDATKAKAPINTNAPHLPHNSAYPQAYRPNEWPPKHGSNEHPIGYPQRPSTYDQMLSQPNRFESSVIKSPEFKKFETIVPEPIRTNATTNSNSMSTNVTAIAATTTTNTNNVPKAVDQSVISKLRNNLELKEIEKQKLLKAHASNDKTNDDINKSDLASILAARIRTKGELKGFTPIPIGDSENPAKESTSAKNAVEPLKDSEKIAPKIDTKFNESLSGLDLMDWGSTCNDFLEQLQNNGNKQRSKAQRRFRSDDTGVDKKSSDLSANSVKSGDNSNGEKDKDAERSNLNKSNSQNNDETSSDEDKPLLLLRQQSLSENSKNRKNLSSSDREKVSPNRKKSKLEKMSPSKRNDSKKRLDIESSSDSSESEDDIDRYSKRSKKMIRKPRTRSSISNKGGDDDDDSDTTGVGTPNKSDKSPKKRSLKDKSSSESDIDANRNSKKRKSLELNSDSGESDNNNNENDDDDDDNDDDEDNTVQSNPKQRRPQPMVVEETMTRSKRKRELEMEIANSKVLRNDKLVRCNSVTTEKRDNKSTPEKKQNSKFADEKSSAKSGEKTSRSKSSDQKKKSNDSDAEVTPKKSNLLKKNLRNSRQQQSSSSESESSSSENESSITERLRSRKPKMNNHASDSDANKESQSDKNKPCCSNSVGESADEKSSNKKSIKNTPKKTNTELDMSEDSRSQFPPGWEEQAYEYKRSLKIPARLITIGRPSWHQHRKSTSLPDLDPQHSSDASETFAEINKKSSAGGSSAKRHSNKKLGDNSSLTNQDSDNGAHDSKSKSIIDLLHQRVIRPTVKSKKARNASGQNEPKILPQSNEVELLPTPGKSALK